VALASFASIRLARFDQLRQAGAVVVDAHPGVLFCRVAADVRAAGTELNSQQGFTFLILGLHADAESARQLVDDRAAAPWLDDASESWGGVLQPFRHHGASNYLDGANPGALFEPMMPAESPAGPVVALTTVGWNREGLDMNRVRDFGAGVMAVRMSMTAVPGMHTQHSFFFPGVLEADPVTVTLWRDEASIRAFAYGQGPHRRQLDRLRAENLADRTSFTRFRVLHSAGTWHGRDPLRLE
jgi:hypothetical protein